MWNTHWTRQRDILNFAGRHFWKTIYHNWTWKGGSKRFEVTFYLQQVNLRDLGSIIDLPPFSVAVSKHWRHKFRKKYINSDNFWTMQIHRIFLDYSVKTMDDSQKGSFCRLKMTEWSVSRFVLPSCGARSCLWGMSADSAVYRVWAFSSLKRKSMKVAEKFLTSFHFDFHSICHFWFTLKSVVSTTLRYEA